MSTGASDIDFRNHPLLGSLASYDPWQSSFTYRFAPAGEDTVKAGYAGGSDFTRAWTAAEKASFTAVTERISQVAEISFTETTVRAGVSFNLQMVDSVPGGWAGYAGGSTYVVGSAGTGLLTHELGHSLGLAHPFDGTALPGVDGAYDVGTHGFNSEYYTVMAYRRGEFDEFQGVSMAWPDSLGVLDIAALQSLYGANETHASGDTTYGLTDKIIAIWDTGGRDEIDFSQAVTDAVIDLRAATLEVEEGGLGRASVIDAGGDGRDDGAYTIAYGVVIEDAHGGAGDDQITGNANNNRLSGGLGDDTLRGGAGDDVLMGSGDGLSIASVPLADMTGDSALSVSDYGDMPGSVTIDMVLQLDPDVTHHQRILSYAPDDSSDAGLELQLWNGTNSYLYFITRDGSSLSTIYTGIRRSDLADGEVHRLTLSRDAASGEIRLYLDGVFEGGGTWRPGEALSADGSLMFGQSQGIWGAAGSDDHAFEGAFGQIAVHDSALSDADIASRAPEALATAGETGLASLWTPQAGSSFADAQGGVALVAQDLGAVTTVALNSDDDGLYGQAGNDSLNGGAGTDTLNGGSGNDTMAGGAGNDSYLFDFVGGGQDVIREDGAGGIDRLLIMGADVTGLDITREGADVVLSDGTDAVLIEDHFSGPSGNRVEVIADETALFRLRPGRFGTNDRDVILGGETGASMTGRAGDDLLIGADGRDVLNGGTGADRMTGGLDNDFYFVDNAGDVILGEIAFSQGGGIDTVRSFLMDYVQPENIELLRLGNVTDTANQNAIGNDAPGVIVGNAGDNSLTGRGGNDVLKGNDGDDWIIGNTGRDSLAGGAGRDTFVYTSISESRAGSDNRDFINGFDRGGDVIDLSGIDANLNRPGEGAFIFIDTDRFSGTAGELRLQSLGGPNAVLVEADVRGDGVADFQIFVNLTRVLGADDFIL